MSSSGARIDSGIDSRIGPRIKQAQRTIDAMIGIYCRDHHGTTEAPCGECRQLRDYALRRLEVCPFGEHKPVCNRCEVHCYSVPMRERVRAVMRYAGPRMPLRHPWLALLHLLDKLRHVPVLPPLTDPSHPCHPGRQRNAGVPIDLSAASAEHDADPN